MREDMAIKEVVEWAYADITEISGRYDIPEEVIRDSMHLNTVRLTAIYGMMDGKGTE